MQSKTQLPCDCGFLQRASEEDSLPVAYDERMNEFFIAYTVPGAGEGRQRLRHCPWCGGKAPESRRGLLFATIPDTEQSRLFALTEPFRTREDVLSAFGEPDDDSPHGLIVTTPAKNGKPPVLEAFRTLTYSHLSDTAVVQIHIAIDPTERITATLLGKYIGPPEPGTNV